MINVSQNIRTAMTNPIKLVNGQVVIHTLGGTNLTFTSTDYLQKMELTQEGGLFLSAVRSGTINLVGAHHGTLAGLKCDVIAKVAVSYDQQGVATYEDINYGTFYIKEQDIDLEKGTTKLKIMDTIGLMVETLYQRGDLAYPCSVSDMICQVANKFDLAYDLEALEALPNADVIIPNADENELEIFEESAEITYRDILDQLAGATGCIARIKAGVNTDTLEFVSVNTASQETLDFDNYLKVKIKDHFGTVNTVTLAREPQEDNVTETDDDMTHDPAGYNLVRYNDTFRAGSCSTGITNTVLESGELQVSVASPNGNWNAGWWDSRNNWTTSVENRIAEGEQFTVVLTIKKTSESTGKPKFYIKNGLGYYTLEGTVGTEYSELYYTGTWKDANSINLHLGWNGCEGTFTIKNFMIKKGAYKPYEPYIEMGKVEVRLTNNEIIDYGADDTDTKRLAMITPILNAVKGLDYTGYEGKTEGHGWYEVGDKITTVDDDTGETFESVLTSVNIAIAGSFKETLKSDTPEQELTDYSTAGSSTKTVWNVQLRTDKQQGEIRGLVQKTDQTNDVVQANYTEFVQTVNQITQAVQKAGGSNLLKNSVGYDKDTDGEFPNWTKTGTVTSQTSPESLNYGAISGNQFDLSANGKIVQRVAVATGTHYVFSARVRKPIVGTARIVLTNGTDTYTVNLADQTEYIWQQVAITGIVPTVGYLDITVECQSASYLYATDLMFSATDTIAPWQQSASEILNTQVALTDQGVKVKSSTSGDYVQITPLEFAGYSDESGTEQKVFYLNRSETRIMKLKVKSQITMPPIKIIPITDGNRAGWAFVKTDEEW